MHTSAYENRYVYSPEKLKEEILAAIQDSDRVRRWWTFPLPRILRTVYILLRDFFHQFLP